MSNEVYFKVPKVPGHEFLMMKPDDLAALVRDAKRFRKLAHFPSGKWGAVFHSMPLPELADALPEVEL